MLAGLPKPPIDPNETVTVKPSGAVVTIRQVLNWVATEDGRKALPADKRLILLEWAGRLV
jgi:hypothetical protein